MMYKKINSSVEKKDVQAIDTSKVVKTGKGSKAKKTADEAVQAEAPVEVTPQPPAFDPTKIDASKFDFPVNSKFMMGNGLYTVIKAHRDSNTEWRTVVSAVNQDQDYMLETLRKDAKSDRTFLVVQIGNPEERPIV